MSDFIFKVPELPEDTLLKRRKIDVSGGKDSDKGRDAFFLESRNTSLVSAMNKNALQPLRQYIDGDLAKPSTSKFVNDNQLNFSQGSFGSFGNHSSNLSVAARSNCFLDTRMRGNELYSVHPRQFHINNVEPCSSFSERKSVFSTGFLPEKGGVKNILINKSINKISAKFSTYETLNRTSILSKDSICPLNGNQSVLENQTMMKSVLQTSVVSIKEQIMNTLENFGHTLLRNAPEMEASFFKVAKDVKSIFENSSMFMNQVMGTTEMLSTLNYTSDSPQQSMMQCQYEGNKPSKKPCNILKEIQSGHNEMHKVEFVKTFTIEGKKLNDSPKDVFEEELNFKSPPSKSIKSKEVNLRNWCPIALEEGLVFTGLNDENVEFKTGTMKKRINNRKILLSNGCFCNLIGKGNPDKKFPSHISEKLKNGLHPNWRVLKNKIAEFQKESQENMKITTFGISYAPHRESSLDTSRRSDRKAKTDFINVCKVNNQEISSKSDFTSPKTSKTKFRSKERQQDQNRNGKTDDKKKEEVEVVKSKKNYCSTLKKQESVKNKNIDIVNKGVHDSRVLHVTRSGRTVKRPGDLWFGGNFNVKNAESEKKLNSNIETENKTKPDSSERKVESGAHHLKRKRNISDKELEIKKSKPEKSKTEHVQTDGKVLNRTERIEKNEENSEMKNPTVNTETKITTKKGRKKDTKKSQVAENVDSWINDFDDGLINISELSSEELKADINKMKFISMETPPLKILRSHLKILRNCTPVQSPCWILSQHTESGVKKFERVRAQTFKQKIPKENVKKNTGKSKGSARNKDVDAVVNWISEREVKSPTKCSKVIKYVIPKRSELEDEDEMEDEEDNIEI